MNVTEETSVIRPHCYQRDIGQVELAHTNVELTHMNVAKELAEKFQSGRAGTHERHQRVSEKP